MTPSTLRFNPLIANLAARLKARGMAPKAIIAATMLNLVHQIYGVLKSRQPFDENWAKNGVAQAAAPQQAQPVQAGLVPAGQVT